MKEILLNTALFLGCKDRGELTGSTFSRLEGVLCWYFDVNAKSVPM